MAKKTKSGNGGQTFDDFNPFEGGGAGVQQFESFDVMRETPPDQFDISFEALAGMLDNETDWRTLTEARQEVEDRFLIPPHEKMIAAAADGPAGMGNIVGVAIGEKEVCGIPIARPAVVVFVKEKLSAPEIAQHAFVPETVGGVPVDVKVTGELWASSFVQRLRPASCGTSVGNCGAVMAGTLGCLVTRQNQLFILSNNHVIALVNSSPLNTAIPQPGRLDGGICPGDTIARLTQFMPINFAAGAANLIDAAIAQTDQSLVDRRVLRPGGVRQPFMPPSVAPAMNMLVQKSGRTTQYRRGMINSVTASIDVSYAPLGGMARFTNQIGIKGDNGIPFSDRGDSGALVTTFPGNSPVGLLFAGNAAANQTFCNDIRQVLATFSVQIVF